MEKNRKKAYIFITILTLFILLISYPIIGKCKGETSVKTTTSTQKQDKAVQEKPKDSKDSEDSEDEEVEDNLGLGNLDDYKGPKKSTKLFQDKLGVIFSALRTIGIVLSVIILIVIGLKYMLGSAEERADYKKTLIPYLWGTFFIFATSVLPQIIYEFVKSIGWL